MVMAIDEFDYGDSAIGLRTFARLQADDKTRALALDALWTETRERALFLYFGVCCRLNAAQIRCALADLDAAFAAAHDFRSTGETPVPAVEEALSALLGYLGLDQAPVAAPVIDAPADRSARPGAVPDKNIFEWHVITGDMRRSRFAGTGDGGARLSPFEDAVRRFTALLNGGSFLNSDCNEGRPVFVSSSFGRPELTATHAYVDYCLEDRD